MGEYRAPKNRTHLREFHWFCLDHVREYNAGWDYYKGLSPDQIEHLTREDSSWQRPTWPLGRLGQSRMDEAVEAELHAFAFGSRAHTPQHPAGPARGADRARPGLAGDIRRREDQVQGTRQAPPPRRQ
jgi:hypothetical protein